MAYEWDEHVGELGLRVRAATEADVFAEAAAAMGELLGDAPAGAEEWRAVEVRGDDLDVLFAAWLEELAFLAETEGFVPAAVRDLDLGPGVVRAQVGGRRASPPHLVKAVTYHGLAFGHDGDGWSARALLDV